MESLENIDHRILLWINSMSSELMDQFMLFTSYKQSWIPLYLLLMVVAYRKMTTKKWWVFLATIGGLIALTDQASVHLFKNMFERYRPCHHQELKELLHLPGGCGGLYGFLSSHAANSFALAWFVGNAFGKRWLIGLLLWASLVAYSRVYLGAHYPSDVFTGALLGIIIALGMGIVFRTISKNKT